MEQFKRDGQLIEQFNPGDKDAFSRVYNCWYKRLCYFAEEITRSKEAAQNIVSDFFVKLWSRDTGIGISKNFLYVSIRNACNDYLDHKGVVQKAYKELVYTAIPGESPIPGEEHLQNKAEKLHLISREIKKMPKKTRMVFELLFHEDLSTAEIAERLNRDIKTVQKQIREGYERIRKRLINSHLPIVIFYFVISNYFF